MSHTKGPWRVKRSTTFVEGKIQEYSWVGAGTIGDETPVLSRSLPELDANAALISAAPDMLSCLEMMHAEMVQQGEFADQTWMLLIETILMKAKGKPDGQKKCNC